MKIGIDARLLNETGVGRYIRNLLIQLALLDKKNSYVIYLLNKTSVPFKLPKQWSIHFVLSRWHTVQEQLELPKVYAKDRLDLLHVPYFTVPLFYSGKIITTVHDLTILRVNTGKASTLPWPAYWVKKLGYRFVLEQGIRKAQHILAVSETIKSDIVNTFGIEPWRCSVTYEGVDESSFFSSGKQLNTKPYILYVGNAYPHKNLNLLLKIAEKIKECVFLCVGPDDYFYREFRKKVKDEGLAACFEFPQKVSDKELREYYHSAKALISPSIAEGFALPPLEALACDCSLIVSDIPVFRELLPVSTTFLQPDDILSWCEAITEALKTTRKNPWNDLQEKTVFFRQYSWKTMAEQTLQAYEDCLSLRSS